MQHARDGELTMDINDHERQLDACENQRMWKQQHVEDTMRNW